MVTILSILKKKFKYSMNFKLALSWEKNLSKIMDEPNK